MYPLTDFKQGYAEPDNPVFVLPAANCDKTVLPSYQNGNASSVFSILTANDSWRQGHPCAF